MKARIVCRMLKKSCFSILKKIAFWGAIGMIMYVQDGLEFFGGTKKLISKPLRYIFLLKGLNLETMGAPTWWSNNKFRHLKSLKPCLIL